MSLELISAEEAQEKFGFLLDAFKYGAPPHGGIAFGWDRIVALLAGADSIREVIAFPKTGNGYDPLTAAPAPITPQQRKEAGIDFKPKPKDADVDLVQEQLREAAPEFEPPADLLEQIEAHEAVIRAARVAPVGAVGGAVAGPVDGAARSSTTTTGMTGTRSSRAGCQASSRSASSPAIRSAA